MPLLCLPTTTAEKYVKVLFSGAFFSEINTYSRKCWGQFFRGKEDGEFTFWAVT